MAPILGALFAIIIGLLAIRPYIMYQQQSFENVRAANTASQFRQLIDAAENYVQASCLPSENSGSIPLICQNISVNSLIAGGYLPAQTSKSGNPYGQQWLLNVVNTSNGVVALLYSSGGQAIPTQMAAEIAAETGQEGGFVPPTSLNSFYNLPTNGQLGAVGAYGHWSLSPILSYISGSSIVSPGDLVALLDITTAGSGASGGGGDNNYLYRTAVQGDSNNSLNTMQTNLGMSGHAVQNAGAVNVTTSLPQSTAPFLAQMVGTTANNNPGGMVETTDAGGDTAIMETDNTGSTLALATAKNASTASLVAKQNVSSLTLADNTKTIDALNFISTAQTVGSYCPISQVGTIAPDAGGSGFPLVCTKKFNSLSISAGGNSANFSITYSLGGAPNSASWQSISGGATQTFSVYLSPSPISYTNNTPKPLFIASQCQSGGGLLGATPSLQFGVNSPYVGGPFSTTSSSFSSVGLGSFSAAPALSAIVPPGYTFNYLPTGIGTCNFMITY